VLSVASVAGCITLRYDKIAGDRPTMPLMVSYPVVIQPAANHKPLSGPHLPEVYTRRRRRRHSGIAGAGLSSYVNRK